MLQTMGSCGLHAPAPAAVAAPQQRHRWASLPRPAVTGAAAVAAVPAARAPLLLRSPADCTSRAALLGTSRLAACARPRAARCRVQASAAGGGSTVLTLPTLLTLARVAAVPALVAAWYSPAAWAGAACTALFVGASLTDWLDGYLARKLNASSAFGAFLDPVADKLMVATVMILLCTRPLPPGLLAGGSAWLLPVLTCGAHHVWLVVIGREITMSALREWAAALGPEAHKAVAVSWVGKWKTATQMTSLTLLLLAHQAAGAATGCCAVPAVLLQAASVAAVPLLGVATFLTAWSLALYFKGLWRFF